MALENVSAVLALSEAVLVGLHICTGFFPAAVLVHAFNNQHKARGYCLIGVCPRRVVTDVCSVLQQLYVGFRGVQE